MLVPCLPSTQPSNVSTVTRRPVARSLFGDLSATRFSGSSEGPSIAVESEGLISDDMMTMDSGTVGLSGQEEVSSPVVFATESMTRQKNQRGRRKISAPLVDTSVRRCTRSAAKLDGFKPVVFEQLPLQPAKRRPRSKPMEEKARPNPEADAGMDNTEDVGNDNSEDVPPQTPLGVLQAIGAELEIDSKLLSREKLMANPKDDSSTGSA